MLNTAPSATASLLLDLYQSLRRLQLVGPADLVEVGLAPNAPLDLEARILVAWLLRQFMSAAGLGPPG